MRVVVTGGAGFIGANLCKNLCKQPFVERVTVLDDLSTGTLENLHDVPVDLHEGSILTDNDIDAVLADTDAVVHLAARPSVPRSLVDPMATHLANATGTLMVLEGARRHGVKHVVVASSSSVYGASRDLPKCESAAPLPVSPYAASKLATEAYALSYGRSFGLSVLVFRFFNVFGPLQSAGHAYAAVVPTFITCALADRPLPVHGDGTQTRDFTFVDTVVTVLAEALRRGVASPTAVNLASGSRVSLLELISSLESVLGHDLPVEHFEARSGDVRDSLADLTQLQQLFPRFQPTALDEGLRTTVRWFEDMHIDAA